MASQRRHAFRTLRPRCFGTYIVVHVERGQNVVSKVVGRSSIGSEDNSDVLLDGERPWVEFERETPSTDPLLGESTSEESSEVEGGDCERERE